MRERYLKLLLGIVVVSGLGCSKVEFEEIKWECEATEVPGGVMIDCPRGDDVFLPDGKDGKDGKDGGPCAIFQEGKEITIVCEDGTETTVNTDCPEDEDSNSDDDSSSEDDDSSDDERGGK